MLKYCTKCLIPNSKPDISFNEKGICNACINFENRVEIDWESRKKEFKKIIDSYKNKSQSNWDCIVPVSGGKDSTYQVVKMLELDMNPLCVTATTCDESPIGRQNIENLKCSSMKYEESVLMQEYSHECLQGNLNSSI